MKVECLSNMIKVLPSLLSVTEKEFRAKLEQVKDLVDMVHIDVMDGKFVSQTCWADPTVIKNLLPPLAYGVHLMVERPQDYFKIWAEAGAERLEVHLETINDPVAVFHAIHELGCEAGVVISPETSVEQLMPILGKADFVLVMGVKPGACGQEFQPTVLAKIKKLREARLDLSIGVDGGVNEHNAPEIIAAGADTLISTNYLFNGGNVLERLSLLRNL